MILGIAEDFSSNVTLDTQLTSLPSSGLYLNSGVHPSITVENLLAFLPELDLTIAAYSAGTTYGKYETSRNKSDLVTSGGVIYQSLQASNLNHTPASSPLWWLPTNLQSLRLKNFIDKVKDKVYADLNLTKRIVNNQYPYNVGEDTISLPADYAGWVFEPKGSDYVSFRLNEGSIQKAGTTPVNLYVINQGVLVDTLELTPANGRVEFERLDYTFSGKGKWLFVIDSTSVISTSSFVDPLKYDGFVRYTCTGTGNAPESATYTYNVSGNGLGFNVSAFMDATAYIENNVIELASYIRATFEYMCFQMFLHNPNNQSNRAQRIQMNDTILMGELKDLSSDTVTKRYHEERKKAIKAIQKTFDSQLDNNNDLEITYSSL